ncbi:permease prefix domain 1-containing protein [Flintibacter sp.]|uniref:permease prefix domain 1-containing protein n=1 Tax=Flintibacter sp. TaxID=1918624 RepID=UPI003A121753
MKPWVEHFVHACVAEIPDLVYGRRLSRELADHLESLASDLERQGLSSDEARQRALEHMGDPGALSTVYLEQWRQRMNTPRHRIPRVLFLIPFLCYAAAMLGFGVLYIINTHNFGKPHPGYWGIVSVLLALVLVTAPVIAGLPCSWNLIKYSCWIYAAMQVLPILCWMALGGPFEVSGMMVSGAAGTLSHSVLAVWSVMNGYQLGCYQKAFSNRFSILGHC